MDSRSPVSRNRELVSEVKKLKEELSRYQVDSFMELKSIRLENEKSLSKLQGEVSNLTKQKSTLEDYINQLKVKKYERIVVNCCYSTSEVQSVQMNVITLSLLFLFELE